MSVLTLLMLATVAYAALLAATMLLTQPLRMRLAIEADDMRAEGHWSAAERDELEWLASSNASSVVGLLLPVAAVFTLFAAALGADLPKDPEKKRLDNDPRFDRLVGMYFVSVAGCSPVASILTVAIMVAVVPVAAVRGLSLRKTAEAPIFKASGAFRPC